MKKNFLFSTLSQFFKNFTNLIIIIIFAKFLDLRDFGIFSYGLTIANIFVILFDYGYNYKLTKEIAQNEINLEKLVQKAFKIKSILSFLGIIIFFAIYSLRAWEEEYFYILLFLILSSIFFSFANDLNIPFRVVNKFHKETYNYTIYSVVLLITSLSSLFFWSDIFTLSLAFLFSRIIFFIVSLYTVSKFSKINVFGDFFKKTSYLQEAKEGFPYAMQIGTSVFMVSIDTIILEINSSPEEVGIYQAGIKILIASTFFISVIQNVLLPMFAKVYKTDKNKFILMNRKFTNYCLVLGVGISAFVMFFREYFVEYLFNNSFSDLNSYMFGFAILIMLRYFALTFGLVLTISDNQEKRLKATATGNIILVILGLILIPRYQILGCLIASIIAHVIMYLMYYLYSKKELYCE